MIGTELVSCVHRQQTLVGGNLEVSDLGAPFSVVASIQPVTGEVLEMLPENARVAARYAMWIEGDSPVLGASVEAGRPGDRVFWRSRTWEVTVAMDWTIHARGIPHWAYILTRVGGDEQ